jgi:hypothetical protein
MASRRATILMGALLVPMCGYLLERMLQPRGARRPTARYARAWCRLWEGPCRYPPEEQRMMKRFKRIAFLTAVTIVSAGSLQLIADVVAPGEIVSGANCAITIR